MRTDSDPRPPDFEPFLDQARAFLGRFQRPRGPLGTDLRGAFGSSESDSLDLYGAADAAYALWILGELEDRTTSDGRRAWAERIRAFQNPETGWFDGSLLPGHGAPHATAFAVGALVLLGSTPASPLRYAEALFASRGRIEAWLDGFRWRQIWTGSHAMGAAAAVVDAPHGLSLPCGWSDALLDALEDRVDPATGFWKRAPHDLFLRRPTTLDLGGAAHFWWLYDRLGRPIPRANQVLGGILELQRRSGLWGNRIFGGAFPHGIDFDALHGLRVAWHDAEASARDAYREPLRAGLRRYARTAHEMLTAPGSVEGLFRSPHKLVGTLDALAELGAVGEMLCGTRLVATRRPLRSALTRVCWQ